MDEIERLAMEFEVGKQVAEAVIKYAKLGIDPDQVLSVYASAVGAGLSLLWEDSTASSVYNVCGSWGKRGFFDANMLDLSTRGLPTSPPKR